MRPSLSRDLLIYGLGEIGVKAFGLITLPLYTHIFTPDEFGLIGVVLTLSTLAMALLSMGSDVAYVRFFFAAKTLDERRIVTSTWIAFLAIWGTAVVLALVPASGALGTIATGERGHGALVAMALILAPVRLTNLMLAQVLRNQFRPVAFTSLNILTLAVSLGFIVYAILVLRLGVAGIVGGMLAAEVLVLPVRAWAARNMLVRTFSVTHLRDLVAYGLPIVPASLAYWVFSASDRILLSNLSTLDQVGLYGVAASLVSITTVAVTALSQAWAPHAVRAFEDDGAAASVLYGRMLTYILAAFGLLAVGLAAFATEFVDVLTADEFSGASAAVAPLALGVVAYASTQVTSGGMTLLRRTGYIAAYSWMAAVINVALNLALIPRFGMLGAAWATAVAYTALTIAYLITSQRLWPIAYERRRSATAAALTVGFVAGSYILQFEPSGGVGLAFKIAYCLAFAYALVLLGVVDPRRVAKILQVARRTTPVPSDHR